MSAMQEHWPKKKLLYQQTSPSIEQRKLIVPRINETPATCWINKEAASG